MKEHTLNLNIYTKRNLNLTYMQKHKNCSRVCVCVSLCTTIVHNTEQFWLSSLLSSGQAPELRCCLLEGEGERNSKNMQRETYRCTESKNNPLRQTQTDTQRHADTATRTCCIQAWLRRQLSRTTWSSMSADRTLSSSTCTSSSSSSSAPAELSLLTSTSKIIKVVSTCNKYLLVSSAATVWHRCIVMTTTNPTGRCSTSHCQWLYLQPWNTTQVMYCTYCVVWWRCGRALNLRLTGRGFNSQPVCFHVT